MRLIGIHYLSYQSITTNETVFEETRFCPLARGKIKRPPPHTHTHKHTLALPHNLMMIPVMVSAVWMLWWQTTDCRLQIHIWTWRLSLLILESRKKYLHLPCSWKFTENQKSRTAIYRFNAKLPRTLPSVRQIDKIFDYNLVKWKKNWSKCTVEACALLLVYLLPIKGW